MAKKTGLGNNPLAWITNTSQKPNSKKVSSEVTKFTSSAIPKFRSFKVKLSVLLREDQLSFLEKLIREIMTNRNKTNRKERITKNTIIRSLIDVLRNLEVDKTNIADEAELLKRIRQRINL